MSPALKIATLASGFTMFTFGTLFTFRNSQFEFSRDALALDHDGEVKKRGVSRAVL